jgi:uncharacterized RDD family membrane protein YckC
MEIAQVHTAEITHPCPNCSREFGPERSCRFCSQVDGFPVGIRLSSAGRRLGAYLLDFVLLFVTLFIGYLIWVLIVWGRGQTPGKQLLGMRVVMFNETRRANWGTMFLRDFVYKGIVFGIIATITFGIGYILWLWLLWDKNNQELWDKMAGTIVIDDPDKLFAAAGTLAPAPTAVAPPVPDALALDPTSS